MSDRKLISTVAKNAKTKELLLQFARHVRNTDEINILHWGSKSMHLLEEVMKLYPEEYKEQVKNPAPVQEKKPVAEIIETALKPHLTAKPTKKKESVYTHQKKHQVKEYVEGGEYHNDKKPWTPSLLDNLLNRFLSFEYPILGKGTQNLVNSCKRPVKAIQKALWRLGVRDLQRSRFANYQSSPIHRNYRGSLKWTGRDFFFLYLATSPTGQKNKACLPSWIANVLYRDRRDVEAEMERVFFQAYNKKPRLSGAMEFDVESEHQLNIIHQAIKRGKYFKFIKEFTDGEKS